MKSQRFVVTVAAAGRGSLLVPVPFDPNEVWGAKERHHIAGTVNGIRVRAGPQRDELAADVAGSRPDGSFRPGWRTGRWQVGRGAPP